MVPWEIANKLQDNPIEILSKLDCDDPFWIGASYAIDPFVGIIVRLPMRDPYQYGPGLNPKVFDKLVKGVLNRDLTGDALVLAIEQISKHCGEEEWIMWYRRILEGEMDLGIALVVFNKFCPDEYRIPPPALNNPKPISSVDDLPRRFFIQPLYPGDRVFWLINSTADPIEIRCYDSEIKRVRNSVVETSLIEFARANPMNVVITGFMTKVKFVAEDILTRDQFGQENSVFPLHRRLGALGKLGLPVVQMSGLLTPQNLNAFFKELNLVFEQGYLGAVVRDLDGYYPFRVQHDILIKPSVKAIVTCDEVVAAAGIKASSMRKNKTIQSFVRLGLTETLWSNISASPPIGRRFEVLSCGLKGGSLLLPIFQNWRD